MEIDMDRLKKSVQHYKEWAKEIEDKAEDVAIEKWHGGMSIAMDLVLSWLEGESMPPIHEPSGVMPTGSTVGVHSEDGELDTIECPTFDLPDCDPLHDCEFSERCDVCFTMSKYRCKKYAIWEGQKPKPSVHEQVNIPEGLRN